MRIGNYINTFSNINFYPFDPHEEDIKIEDIAHALSLVCRFNGHCSNFYSVAQHCINCANEAKLLSYSPKLQLACLLHDASEAYIADITSPVKKNLPEYIKLEAILQKAIDSKYHLSDLTTEDFTLIKKIDVLMLDYECSVLLKNSFSKSLSNSTKNHNFSFRNMNEVENEYKNIFFNLIDQLSC